MPLSDIPPDANPKRAEALRQARAKILDKAQRKFLFQFQELRAPTGFIEHEGRLVGLRLSQTEVVDGQARIIADSEEEVRGPFVVSSIGSIPERIHDIPQQGEVYRYADAKAGLLLAGETAVFAAGNVLTGKGNIKDSLDSGTEIGIAGCRKLPWAERRIACLWPRSSAPGPISRAKTSPTLSRDAQPCPPKRFPACTPVLRRCSVRSVMKAITKPGSPR